MVKFIVKSVLFTGIIAALLLALSPVFVPKWVPGHIENGGTYMAATTNGFYALEEDSLDALLVGSSQVLRDIDARALTERGVSSYARATTVQPPAVTCYYVRDALKTQRPRVVLGEFSFLYQDYDPDDWEGYVHYAFDWMPMSPDKLTTIYETLKTSRTQSMADFALPFLYYHDRWTELTAFDVEYLSPEVDKTDENRGSILLDPFKEVEYTPLDGDSPEKEPYDPENLEWYEKTIALCQENGVDFVLLRLPRAQWTEEQHAADAALAEKYGVPFIDFNLKELYGQVGLDASTDFYDKGHLSRTGAEKLTGWLGDWLTENGYGAE